MSEIDWEVVECLKELFQKWWKIIEDKDFEKFNEISKTMKTDQEVLSFLRFTFSYRDKITEWKPMLERAKLQLDNNELVGLI